MSQITKKQSDRVPFWALFLLLWLGSVPFSHSAGEKLCLTCGVPLEARAWKYPQGLVCDDCHLFRRKCSVCALPAVGEMLLVQDGRTICKNEMDQVVGTGAAAKTIFEKVREELTWITEERLKLRTPGVEVQLFDAGSTDMREDSRSGKVYITTGMADSEVTGDGFKHTVYLLSYQMPDEVHAVAAHEYAHLWINENKAAGRELEHDTEEAFCELVAWKYMDLKRNREQRDVIWENDYTNGMIRELIDLEVRYGFNNLVDWVRKGTEARLSEPVVRKFVAQDISAGLRAATSPEEARVFESLELKGILFSAKNPMAMINDKTIALNESVALVVAGKPRTVRCLEIHPDRVVLLYEDTNEKAVLSTGK